MSISKKYGLILEIQAAAIKENVDVTALLRMAKIAAVKLDQSEMIGWIDSELNGYNCKFDELPDYRKNHGTLRARNPFHGIIPVYIRDERTEDLVTRAPMTDGVAALQALVRKQDAGATLIYSMGNAQRSIILKLLDTSCEPILEISSTQIEAVLNRVLNLLIDWTLELEKKGITGENMTFSDEDKEKASSVTHNIIAQNVGYIGDSSRGASVSISQEGRVGDIDAKLLRSFFVQAEQSLPMLPENVKESVGELIVGLPEKDQDAQRRALTSIRAILEGASSNLVAQGILQLISRILS